LEVQYPQGFWLGTWKGELLEGGGRENTVDSRTACVNLTGGVKGLNYDCGPS
jgi:hypothetical protein